MLYNVDGTFNRRRMGSPDSPYPYPYIRLDPFQTLSLSMASSFRIRADFSGYARVDASEGISIELSYSNKVYLPITIKSDTGNCYNDGLEWQL